MSKEQLPVLAVIPELKKTLSTSTRVVLQAPPGAGKSTLLPLMLLDEPWLQGKKILMLEPRRLAARAVAFRLAEQLGESPGGKVGYRIRFETKVSDKTRIEVLTEGILTRMLQQDNALEDIGLVILDEFHERSLQADLALALCRESQRVLRDDLRIMIMSATLDGAGLIKSFDAAPLIKSEGRQYPVELRYITPSDPDHLSKSVYQLIRKVLNEESEGDILVFLPGSGDILRIKDMLEESVASLPVHPLFGDLPFKLQQDALQPDPAGRRKIILSTSIAETSLTIEGIRIVIDSGYSRVPQFDPRTGLTRLQTVRVTKDTAEQRAGRAGRLGPGICYRLGNAALFDQLQEKRVPEILEADLTQLVLELAQWGSSPEQLLWISEPPASGLIAARKVLEELKAISYGRLTEEGKDLLQFPTHPRIAHLLQSGRKHGLAALAADLAALLEEKDPLPRDSGTDVCLRIEALIRWRNNERVLADRNILERVERVSKQWRSLLKAQALNEKFDHHHTGMLLAAAYPERIARREQVGRYRLANGKAARIPGHDPMQHEEWILAALLDAGKQEGKIFLSAPFDPADLIAECEAEDVIRWDETKSALHLKKEWKFGSLVVKSEALKNSDPEKIAEVLIALIQKEGLHVFEWTEDALQLCARVCSLKKWSNSNDWPDFSNEGLLNSVDLWARPFLQNIRKKEDLKKLDLHEMLISVLDWNHQQELQRLCPTKLEVPSGSLIKLEYSTDASPPVLAVRLQEVFGLSDTPKINHGRQAVLLHLLSPGFKPVQVTADLRSFWNNTYHEVRKELRVRYPKHSWPEDPWTATAVRGTGRKKIQGT